MSASLPFLVVLAAVAASSAAVRAQSLPDQGQMLRLDRAQALSAVQRLGWSNTRTGPPLIRIAGSGALDLPYALASVSAVGGEVQPRTAIDYRFAPVGLVGAVGYLCVKDSQPPDSRSGGPASSSQFLPQSGFVGAQLSYPFR
ncbi:MAG TPA: hypothetical protein VII63_02100 [Caulobacteraceae bacterium]